MKNLLAGIMTKFSGSTVSTNVGGRIYFEQAPEGATMPYIVFYITSSNPSDTFTERVTDTYIQFSMFSSSSSVSEIGTIYANLRTLFDYATLTVSGNTFLRCEWQNLTTMVDDTTTVEGNKGIKLWAADYLMTTEAS